MYDSFSRADGARRTMEGKQKKWKKETNGHLFSKLPGRPARIRDVTCCISPLLQELYAEKEFDCLQIEEHLTRHVTLQPTAKGPVFLFFCFAFPFF